MASLLMWVASLLSMAAVISATPIKVGQTFMAKGLDPTFQSTPWSLVSHGIAEKLFTVNKNGEVVPQLAQSVTKIDQFTWQVTLTTGYKFSDGTAVTADHVVNALTTQNTQNSYGNDALGVMTVTKVDATKIQVVSTIPHPAMDAALANWVFVIFLKTSGSYLYTGPFAVEQFTKDDQIDLIPNTHYPQTLDRPDISIKYYSSGDVLSTALKAGGVDLACHLPTDQLADLRAVDGVTVKSFDVGYHYMMFHNTRTTSVLSDLRVRQAVDLVIDRQALAQELKGGTGTRSLFPSASPYHLDDSRKITADKSAAEALLDQAGWVLENGIRIKDSKQLTLFLVSYPFRPGLGIMQPLIQASLESLGIKVNAVDVDLWSDPHKNILADKTYDLLMWAQHTLPNGDPQWFLNAFFRGDPMDSSNYAGVNAPAIDSLLDRLALAGHENGARVAATNEAQHKILSEVAVSNLVTPQWHIGLGKRLSTYEPWGADYYVIRADFQESPAQVTEEKNADSVDRVMLNSSLVAVLLFLWSARL